MRNFDYLLVGGGLQNALIAAALAEYQPRASVGLIERSRTPGAGHTWCFHGTDVPAAFSSVVARFVDCAWDGYEVAFPRYRRAIAGSYHAISGARLDRGLRTLFSERQHYHLELGRAARHIEAERVELEDGEVLGARFVVDARGPEQLRGARIAGYQKFVGLELELAAPSPWERPLLMDARVAQVDGYRFVYVLPFSPRRVLIEDTYFSDTPELHVPELSNRVLGYALEHGLDVERVIREEAGVLPLPRALREAGTNWPLRAGYAGGFFHPTTGYSFPIAARLADAIGRIPARQALESVVATLRAGHARQARFATLLNRLLFDGFEGAQRRGIFERFYGLPEPTIARFYSLTTSPFDRARILCGSPPRGLSLRRAVARGQYT
jgi:lycopene beta-cyclase